MKRNTYSKKTKELDRIFKISVGARQNKQRKKIKRKNKYLN